MALKILKTAVVACVAIFVSTKTTYGAAANEFQTMRAAETIVQDDAASVEGFLQRNFEGKNWGMVVALVDAHGTRVFSAGKMGDGTDRLVGADTLFEIGSITKTFTALLLEDMVERGAMKFDDTVADYLPPTVYVPSFQGKEITLVHLAEQTSGLPFESPINMLRVSSAGDNPWAEYTVEKMYSSLIACKLSRAPGEAFEYSNLGMGLLGNAIALKAGKDYESLVVERICGPLHMGSTRVVLSDELKGRLATGHDTTGAPAPNWDMHAIVAAGGLRSSANDMAKYVAAQLGLSPGPLTPLMVRTHELRHKGDPFVWGNTAMPWYDLGAYSEPGTRLMGHGGGTGGYATFIGFDVEQRRGIVVLSNQKSIHSSVVGMRILQHARLTGIDPVKLMPVRKIDGGAGLALEVDPSKKGVRVTSVIPRSPAAKAGIPAGSTIYAINDMPTAGKALTECAAMIHGPANTTFKLSLAGPGDTSRKSVELIRQSFFIDE